MYVGTIIEYDDQSAVSALPITEVRNQPLYLSLFTSDKGPEEWTELSGEDWFKAYGNSISFARHGQPLLQAAMSINAGAKLLSKRLVAEDAKLAHIGIVATVTAGDNANTVNISYKGISVAEGINKNDPQVVYDALINSNLGENDFLLFTITDNGRGVSDKRFAIRPNYRLSRSKEYVVYSLDVTENGATLESINFSAIPHLVVDGSNYSIQNAIRTNSKQLCCDQNYDGMTQFINKIAELTGKDITDIEAVDFLYGYDKKGVKLDYITINTPADENGNIFAMNNKFGIDLKGGDHGSFSIKDENGQVIEYAPIKNTEENNSEYVKQARLALGCNLDVEAGEYVFDTIIYDLDRYKIDLCIDANYPTAVKRSIEALVTYREDFCYLRDFGTGITSFEMIETAIDSDNTATNNKFISNYCNSYDIIDPYSKKQITVTIGYTLARLMVEHLNSRRNLPVCGIKHGMIITEAIKGTLNFAPVICPDPQGNQKEKMEDLRVNYATYIGEDLVIETEYTSQDNLTQFSFLNNVLATQEVVRAIRNRCPVIRYSFIDGEDLERYKADIEEVIARYTSNFRSIQFSYVNDPVYVNNKIFYAALKVAFRDFIQTEWFKVTAISITES